MSNDKCLRCKFEKICDAQLRRKYGITQCIVGFIPKCIPDICANCKHFHALTEEEKINNGIANDGACKYDPHTEAKYNKDYCSKWEWKGKGSSVCNVCRKCYFNDNEVEK